MNLAPPLNDLTLVVESPLPRARVYDECVSIVGTIATKRVPEVLFALCGDLNVGATAMFNPVAGGYRFRLLVRVPLHADAEAEATVQFALKLKRATEQIAVGELPLVLLPAHLARQPYGDVVAPDRADVLHRENIYGYGPPLENPGAEIARLILEYLASRSSVLDLGCGAGAYGPVLIEEGHRWLGAETNPLCWSILERRGLPFERLSLTSSRLPFRDAQFDATIAIEVLEHIENLDSLIAELARVTRDRLIVSVPNMEVIPYYAPLGVVPWHLLESTHVNFFTRASLGTALARHFAHVEVFSYGEPPVKSADQVTLHAHLFAIAAR